MMNRTVLAVLLGLSLLGNAVLLGLLLNRPDAPPVATNQSLSLIHI